MAADLVSARQHYMEGDDAMVRPVVFTVMALIVALDPALSMKTERSNDGLKVWLTRGGSYCIREVAVFGKVRCQSEAAWAKEGVTFTRSGAASRMTMTAAQTRK
jgi:hypothetical protein